MLAFTFHFVKHPQLIETKMEQFKVCEKDTKTKAYSNGGLERSSRSDPKDAEREEKREWLNGCLEKLSDLVDTIEAELEKISAGRGKQKNKEQVIFCRNSACGFLLSQDWYEFEYLPVR